MCLLPALSVRHQRSRCRDPARCAVAFDRQIGRVQSAQRAGASGACDDTRSGSDTAADTHVLTAPPAAAHPPSPLLDASILTILQTVDWVLGLRVRTWKRVPAKFAPDVALEFSSMLTELAEAASEAAQVRALGKLWVFPTVVLCLPMERQSTRARARYLATRLKMWRTGALEPLLDSVPVVDGQHLRPIPPEAVEHRIIAACARQYIGAAADSDPRSAELLHDVTRTRSSTYAVAGDTALGAIGSRVQAHRQWSAPGLARWRNTASSQHRKKVGGVRPVHDAAESLQPDQVRRGTPGRARGAVLGRLARCRIQAHAVLARRHLRTHSTASTITLMRIVQGRFPALWPLVRSTYAHPAPLRVGAHVLASACGVQQGDPLGPLLFSLVLHKVLADTESPGLSSFWYLDDGSIVGPLAQLEGFLDAFSSDAAVHGMCVNRTKTQLVLPPGMHTAVVPAGLADLPRLAWDQAQLLGVPLDFTGSGESLVPITNASAQVLQLAEQVAKLSHPEEAFYLLRGSVGPKRLMHLARTMPPPVVTRIFAEFDRAWRSIVARALGVMAHEVGEPCKAEWRLPCSLGGLGLTAAALAAARRKQASFQAAARTGDAAGVSFQAVILDTYGRREQCGAAFLETLVAAYMRHRGVSKMLASTALHRSLSLAVYRSVAAAVLLRHPGPTLPVASQHWLETGRRLFVGEVLSESEAESH
ncbi:hypothetical protein FVE85_4420 [Porphyridium purpureum]|uniref:Reverse transcriptase domain-containing protein n=1 Tax=Porphyridium purpureum TaxID=35688 RepID=A0A5J4YFE5_PORPP|nr:hypothetical protein FVE85_4420 [Porphyridium purpureum]|eukprot:POR2643..scf248_52